MNPFKGRHFQRDIIPRILPAAGQRCCSTADGVLSREWCHATTTGDVPVCAGA